MSDWRYPLEGAPGQVDPSRTINTGAGLQGGGDLSADRTFSIASAAVTDAMLALKYDQLTADETKALSGAVALTTRTTRLDASGGNLAMTLADSTRVGQRKSIVMPTAPAGNHADVTPATFGEAGKTKVVLSAQWHSVELEWQAGGWRVVSLVGAAVS
jgi:hypothetical protein